MLKTIKWAALLPVIALGCLIGLVSTIAVRAEPDTCAAKRAAVRNYSESVATYLAGPNLDREAVLSLLRPYENIACPNWKDPSQ